MAIKRSTTNFFEDILFIFLNKNQHNIFVKNVKGIRIPRKINTKLSLKSNIKKIQNKNTPTNISESKIFNKIFIVNSFNTYI